MALPMETVPEEGRLTDDALMAIIRHEDSELTAELGDFNNFRTYYENEQDVTYATEEFKRAFGDMFKDLKSNWCEVVVDAVEERIGLDRILFRDEGQQGEIDVDSSDEIWAVLHNNDLADLENTLYNSALVEGRAAVIIWPDDELGARVDAQPAQNVRVSYDSDDHRKVSHAIKRWITPAGELRLTLYTPEFIYKYRIPPTERLPVQTTATDDMTELRERQNTESAGWAKRFPSETGDPSWPLPNPFGEVPVVEFTARRNLSELHNILALQDSLNMTLANMMVSSHYNAVKQAYIVSSNAAPDGGWKRRPGYVWTLAPEEDIEGRPLNTQVGTIDETKPDTFIIMIETFLQHIGQISKTPTYYFFASSKGGGRGDAPSGDALKVTETSLVKKVQKYQENWSSQWIKIGRLIWTALKKSSELPKIGETSWTNPQAHFMGLILEEARRMIQDLYLPPEFAWRHIGLSESEIREARTELDKMVADAKKGEAFVGPLGRTATRYDVNTELGGGSDSQAAGLSAGNTPRTAGQS